MAEVRLTKNELRHQQHSLDQLEKYLPTLQLKKAMLQNEVQEARQQIAVLTRRVKESREEIDGWSKVLSQGTTLDNRLVCGVTAVRKHYENIAGVEVPTFEGVDFQELPYSLLNTPVWLEDAVDRLRALVVLRAELSVSEEKRAALEKELREVSIRVNLFEKILIPRALVNIKRIRVFLGDQQLAAVGRAKVAKNKIEEQATANAFRDTKLR